MCVSPFQWCCKKYQFHLLSGRTAQIFDIMTYYLVILPFKLSFPNSIITDEEEKYYLFSEKPVLCFRYADGEYPVALRNIFENARESSYPTPLAISLIFNEPSARRIGGTEQLLCLLEPVVQKIFLWRHAQLFIKNIKKV